MNTFRFLTLNVKASNPPALFERLVEIAPDVVVLTEYRLLKKKDKLHQQLGEAGWNHQAETLRSHERKGALLASRVPFQSLPLPHADPSLREWAVLVEFEKPKLQLLGAYLPYRTAEGAMADALYGCMISLARTQKRFIAAGDFNNSLIEDIESGRQYRQGQLGIADVAACLDDCYLRGRPEKVAASDVYTFETLNFGRRIDYIFATKELSRLLISAYHDHSFRAENLSDHSAVIATFNLG